MPDSLDPGALLARHYSLPRGPRVCLRLVRPRDQQGIRELAEAHGAELNELELARLVTFDLTRRLVLCATALINATERVVGVGCICLDDPDPQEPDLLVVDARLTDGLAPLLRDALVGQAAALQRARAA